MSIERGVSNRLSLKNITKKIGKLLLPRAIYTKIIYLYSFIVMFVDIFMPRACTKERDGPLDAKTGVGFRCVPLWVATRAFGLPQKLDTPTKACT